MPNDPVEDPIEDRRLLGARARLERRQKHQREPLSSVRWHYVRVEPPFSCVVGTGNAGPSQMGGTAEAIFCTTQIEGDRSIPTAPPVASPGAWSCRHFLRSVGRCSKQRRTPRTSAAPTTTTTRRSRPATTAASMSVARQLARRCYHVLRNVRITCTRSRRATARPSRCYRSTRSGTPTPTSGSPAVSSWPRRARQHSCWTAYGH
jgi:hypothetical protein